jgi:hypothetical protein
MTRTPRALPIVLLFVLAACTTSTVNSPTAEPTAEPTPTSTLAPTATEEPTDSPEPTPSSTPIEGEGGFTIASNAEADALFAERFTCENSEEGYQVDFPAEWNANAEFGRVQPCSWFAPTEYETGDPGELPDEVAIEIFVLDGGRDYDAIVEITDQDEGIIGATQPTARVRYETDGVEHYEYVVQLGRTPEEGPNLVARTASDMGGDFDLNRAVLDRMMATMEFIGTIQ